MQHLKGVEIKKDAKGRMQKITFDYKLHAEFLEDYLDNLLIEARKNGEFIPLEEVKKQFAKEDKKAV